MTPVSKITNPVAVTIHGINTDFDLKKTDRINPIISIIAFYKAAWIIATAVPYFELVEFHFNHHRPTLFCDP